MTAKHKLAISLTALLSIANLVALAFLVRRLLGGAIGGSELLLAAGQIWTVNVIAFGLWYWELDGGGPPRRRARPLARRDFAFVTNASAFSPSDTVPLTSWAKLLMLIQSSISIVTLILVAARAVNMLG